MCRRRQAASASGLLSQRTSEDCSSHGVRGNFLTESFLNFCVNTFKDGPMRGVAKGLRTVVSERFGAEAIKGWIINLSSLRLFIISTFLCFDCCVFHREEAG